jgi:RimJ/RimL family protein N-acetyltransferase
MRLQQAFRTQHARARLCCLPRRVRVYPADAGAATRFDLTGSGMDGRVRLETHRLRLPVQPRDLDSLSALNGDPSKMKYISPPLSRHQVQEAPDWMIAEWHRIG